jgi:hypothetical protein
MEGADQSRSAIANLRSHIWGMDRFRKDFVLFRTFLSIVFHPQPQDPFLSLPD